MEDKELIERVRKSLDGDNEIQAKCLEMIEGGQFSFRLVVKDSEKSQQLGLLKTRFENFILPNISDYEGIVSAIKDLEMTTFSRLSILAMIDINGEFRLHMDNSLNHIITVYRVKSMNIEDAKDIEQMQLKNPDIKVNLWKSID